MVDILHRIGTTRTAEDVYTALTTLDGLAAWWTEDVEGDPGEGGKVAFRFPVGGFDMAVLETRPHERVVWEVVDGPEEWIGTTVRFELSANEGWTILRFTHAGWREPVEFMAHCSTKWATFLMSLKSHVESGAGEPAPRDVRISDWH